MAHNRSDVEHAYEEARYGSWDELHDVWRSDESFGRPCSCYRKPTSGWTFLHQAAYFGNVEACDRLLRLGAIMGRRVKDGQTPADVAEARGHNAASNRLDWPDNRKSRDSRLPDDAEVHPSSHTWDEAQERHTGETLWVSYGGTLIDIPAGSVYFVDSTGAVLIGWHGTYDPSRGMDGEPMVDWPRPDR